MCAPSVGCHADLTAADLVEERVYERPARPARPAFVDFVHVNRAKLAVVVDPACSSLRLHRCGFPVTPSIKAIRSLECDAVHAPSLRARSSADECFDDLRVVGCRHGLSQSNVTPLRVLQVHICFPVQE